MSIEKKYQKLSQIEHIIKRPGMYIGSIELRTDKVWVYSNSAKKMVQKELTYSPGFYKLFDEIILNALDESTRDDTLTKIKVTIDAEKGEIEVYNNGKGIDVVKHPKYGIYVPELIFGNLLSGTSYDDEKIRVSAGMHGLGAKLTAIFSKQFIVEVGDPKSKKRYRQVFSNSLSKKSEPRITSYDKKEGFVRIKYIPHYNYFKMKGLDKSNYKIIEKRVYDIAGLSSNKIKVSLNGEVIDIKTFSDYVDLYIGDYDSIYECCGPRWKIVVCKSLDDKFSQVSFVNGIHTHNGGKHVDHIVNQITSNITKYIRKKYKKVSVRDSYIKDNLWIFITSVIENPTFSSQTKDELMTAVANFGSKCELSSKFIKNIISRLGIVKDVLALIHSKEMAGMSEVNKKKKSRIKNIPKLEDANWAGTKKSNLCTLILTEGDSAKSMALSGLAAIENSRNMFGVFPLKGKLLNVREASLKQIKENKEIDSLKKIVGLNFGKKYTKDNISYELRYNSILLMMDADVDGSHIKGLLINMMNHFWPSLLKIPGFMRVLITPMVKVKKDGKQVIFNTLDQFDQWKNNNEAGKWIIKYYKGLGTNTVEEAKEYFREIDNYTIEFRDGASDSKYIQLAFSKKLANERKKWLKAYDPSIDLDRSKNTITYSDFINKELIHFSNYDNIRSIPSIYDGLKPSQRKVLYAGFKKKVYSDIKVSQFVGYISEHTAYHHGENSLISTVIGMAQNFTGSNNINLYIPSGQFGTRLVGGKDHSSARYIFTRLNTITELIYHPDDMPLLDYLDDDGFKIEPQFYLPIIPMILVNGSEGIGTGYSTFIPKFNPSDIIDNIKNKLDGGSWKKLVPWYNGYTGVIKKRDSDSYFTMGKYTINNNKTLEITELPIGLWVDDYKNYIEGIVYDSKIKLFSSIKNYSNPQKIHFVLKINDYSKIKKIEEKKDDYGITFLERYLKLVKIINIGNIYLYDLELKLKKYKIENILDDFYSVRLKYYKKRKEYLLNKLETDIKILKSKIRFIEGIASSKLKIFKKNKKDIIKILESNKFYRVDKTFDYLINMPFYNLSIEKIEDLDKKLKVSTENYNKLKKTSEKSLWLDDLNKLKVNYN